MTLYFDLSNLDGAVGIFASGGAELIFTGTGVHTEPAKYRGIEAAERLARDSDLHFWFDDAPPEVPCYTVPQTELCGYDSHGGLFAGSPCFSFRDAEPLYYIDREKNCFLITEDCGAFRNLGDGWRERMVPTGALEIFDSYEQAREKYAIRRPENHDELLAMLKEIEE